MRQLRTPSDFEAQAAATQLRRQTTLAEQARLREVTASQQGRAGVHGGLAESYAAPAREAQEVRKFEGTKREWEQEDRQAIESQRMNQTIGNAASGLKKSVGDKTGLEAQSIIDQDYPMIKSQLEAQGARNLPLTTNMGQLEMLIQQSYTNDQQFKLKMQERKIRLKAEVDVEAATVKSKRDITLQREKNIGKKAKESASAERLRVNARIYNKQSGRVRELAKTVGLSGPVPQALKFFKNLSNIASETLPFLSDSELKEQINKAQADAGVTNLPSALDSVDAALAGLAISAVRAVNPDRRSTVLFKMVKSLTDPSIWKSNAKILAVINELDAFVNEEGAGTVGEIAGQTQVGNIPALEQFKSDREELEELRRRKAVQ